MLYLSLSQGKTKYSFYSERKLFAWGFKHFLSFLIYNYLHASETTAWKKLNFQSEKHAIECKWGCNHHKCAKLFLRCSVHHALASKKKILAPDLSYGQKCHKARLVQVLRGWTCPIKKCLAARSFQKFRAGSVSWPEVSGSSIYIFARVMKVGSAVIRDERWGAHYTILCNLSKPPRILMILY